VSGRTLFADVPIRRKLVWLTLLSSAAGTVPAAIALVAYAWFALQAATERDLGTLSRITADGVAAAVTFNDPKAARETLAALHAKSEIDLACLYEARGGSPFARYSTLDLSCPQSPGAPGIRENLQHLTATVPVILGGETIGWLLISQDLRSRQRALNAQVAITIAVLAAAFLASAFLGWRLQRGLSEPILRLAGMARRVSESQDYALRAGQHGRDEIGTLVGDFNRMLEQIGERDRALQEAKDALSAQVREKTDANAELQTAMLRLRETQAQLVQSEKLASLGALVAGVAHEINTPIGVGVTAASTLQTRTQRMREEYASGTLTRSDLERYSEMAVEASQILLKNLQRAADLIHSFKQVAVDQSSGERRRFLVREYIDEILLSLAPRLKKTPHRVELECAESAMLDSYPGALAQILTNLVSNALMHAFPEGRAGHLRIRVETIDRMLRLSFSDDGVGIPPADLKRVFDPFFTTKRGAGGSGLGLHIVYNLATQILRGDISVVSEPGRGATFVLTIPLNVSEAMR
jgi:signal transduction histidine kinase